VTIFIAGRGFDPSGHNDIAGRIDPDVMRMITTVNWTVNSADPRFCHVSFWRKTRRVSLLSCLGSAGPSTRIRGNGCQEDADGNKTN
jgi:hypothetical protein